MMRRLLTACGVVLGVSLVAAPKASATTFNLNDIYCNCLPGGSAAVGTVDGTASGGNLTITVDLNDLLNFHYSNAFDLFGFGYDGGTLSLVGPIITKDALGNSVSVSGWGLTQAAKSGAQDGAGKDYNWFIDCPLCSGGGGGVSGVNYLQFTISSSAGPPTEAAIEFLKGANKNDFAASVTRTGGISGCTGVIGGGNGAGQSSDSASNGTGAGTVDCSGATTVPDGGTTVGLLGLGILGLAYLRRRIA